MEISSGGGASALQMLQTQLTRDSSPAPSAQLQAVAQQQPSPANNHASIQNQGQMASASAGKMYGASGTEVSGSSSSARIGQSINVQA